MIGSYDEIRCEAKLPDDFNPGDEWFQTKSFPYPSMCRYTITEGGRLVDSDGNDLEPHGYLVFYTSIKTEADYELVEYRAYFDQGDLRDIVRATEEDPRRYYGLASFRWFSSPSLMFGDPDES